MKYLVMECHFSYAVVLAEDGRFLNVANMHYEVGQTVTNIIEMQHSQTTKQPSKNLNRRWMYSIAAIAACLIMIFTGIFQFNTLPYASVYMTINPEVRIDVNRAETVIGLEGINQDGKDLIVNYDYSKKHLDQVMDELVDLAIEMGYLHEGGAVTLTFDAKDEEWIITRGDALSIHLDEYVTEKMEVTIQVTNEEIQHYEVVVPIDSEDDYGESDYGTTSDNNESDDQDFEDHDEFEDSDDDDSNKFEDSDDGQTDYGIENSSEGDEDSDEDSDDDSDDGASAYETDDEN